MRIPFAALFALGLVAATLLATFYDLAMIGGRLLKPWFGWMLP